MVAAGIDRNRDFMVSALTETWTLWLLHQSTKTWTLWLLHRQKPQRYNYYVIVCRRDTNPGRYIFGFLGDLCNRIFWKWRR